MIRHCTALSLLALVLGTPSLVRAQGGPEVVVYFHTDAVGSVRMVTDANGAVVEHTTTYRSASRGRRAPRDRRRGGSRARSRTSRTG